jgi:uncharacterized membrane protein YkoI
MKINRLAALAAIAVLVIATMSIIAVQVFAQPDGPLPQEPDDGEENEAEDEAPTGEAAISADEAVAAAQDYLGDYSSPGEVELENERGTLVYSVEFSGAEVEVDAATGEVVGAWSDDD